VIEQLPDGTVFGFLDNFIVLCGMYLGVDIEGWVSKRLGKESNPLLGAVVGATGFNTISDGVASAIDPATVEMSYGIILGCLIGMIFIPVAEMIRKNKKK